jgi:DNA replication protein DnaC
MSGRANPPDLLPIDEVDYLSHFNRLTDLLSDFISRRYRNKTTVVTANRAFKEWHEVFPNAAGVVPTYNGTCNRTSAPKLGAQHKHNVINQCIMSL